MNSDSEGIPLTLYIRQGCHLCQDMEQQIHELLEPGSYRLTLVDIDSDKALQIRYNESVPVLKVTDTEICHHFLDLNALRVAQAGYNTPVNG